MSGKCATSHKLFIWMFLGIETILYGLLIYIDLFSLNSLARSNWIKFAGILSCFLFVLISYWLLKRKLVNVSCEKDSDYRGKLRDSRLMIIIFAGTLLADWCILLNNYYILGVGVFSIVQLLYLYRISRILKVDFKINLLVFVIPILVFILLIKKMDLLFFLSIFYGVGIVGNGLRGLRYLKRYGIRKRKETLFFLGLILFLLCDIHVAIYNMGMYIPVNNDFLKDIEKVAMNLMWVFYLPSQVLISLSVPISHNS